MANKVEQNNMKDSGYSWIREVPSDWNIGRIKELFYLSKEKINGNAQDYQIFSLTMKGLKKRDVTTNEGQIAASYDKYARLRKDDIVLNPMDLKSGFVARQSLDGIISPAYSIMRPRTTNINSKFFERYFQYHYFYNIFFPFGKGVSYDYRWTLGDSTLINFPIVVPPQETQEKIVSFLDKKTENIDSLIKKKEKMIELLQEKRSSIITHAVTKGLDPDVEMKDSGVDWIGEIPLSWEIDKVKYYIKRHFGGMWGEEPLGDKNDLICLRVADFDYEKLSLSLKNKTLRNYKKNITHKLLNKGDLLIEKSGGGEKTTVGRVVGYNINEACMYSNFVERIILSEGVSANYLLLVFRTMHYLRVNTKHIKQTTGIQNLDINSYFNSLIPIPSLEAQEKISQYLNVETANFDLTILKIKKQIKYLKEYKSSLIYHTATGKLKI